MESAIWGFIGTAVGAIASIATTWMASKNAAVLFKQNADNERAELKRTFQRETLISLQEAIHDAMRLINRAYVEDYSSYKNTSNWVTLQLSEEVNEETRLAQRKVAILN